MGVRIIVAEAHAVFREAISLWLSQNHEFEVIASAQDGPTAVSLVRQWRPDVVLMDAILPDLNGIDATRQITSERPDTRVLIFSDAVSSQSVRGALEAGAAGYLSKQCSPEELMRAIHEVVSEGAYLGPAATSTVVQFCLAGGDSDARSGEQALTPRQRQIVQRIAEGQSIKEIARRLGLSPKTVDWHKVQIMRKLRIDSTAGLVRYALAEGLTYEGLMPVAAV